MRAPAAGLAGALLVAGVTLAVDVAPAEAVVVTCHGVRATIVGTAGDDVLRGTSRRDVIAAGSGDDVLEGLGGDDLLCGDKGEDTLRGGRGADGLYGGGDRYQWDPAATYFFGDHLAGGRGDDVLDAGYEPGREDGDHEGRFDELVFARGHAVVLDLARGVSHGQGHDRIVSSPELAVTGSALGDVIRGDEHLNWLYGGSGGDRVLGRGGDDRLWEETGDLDSGDDLFDGGAGNDAIFTRSGADTVRGGIEADDLVVRNATATTVEGGAGNDVVSYHRVLDGSRVGGGPGADVFRFLPLSSEAAALDMTAGTLVQGDQDVVVTGFDRWVLVADQLGIRGTEGPDYLEVVRASTTMELLGGDDRVMSGDGDDTVDGGAGSDFADLGAGTNSCAAVENGPC